MLSGEFGPKETDSMGKISILPESTWEIKY